MNKQYWYNAQLLRLIAAVCIVYIHLEGALTVVFGHVEWLNVLRTGTDTFFVLSGFLSCYIMGRTHRPPGEFLWGRIIRIMPVFWLFTLLAFFVINALMSADNASTPSELLLSMFLVPYQGGPVLYPTWSLTLIMAFAGIVTLAYTISHRYGALIAALLTFTLAGIGEVLGRDTYAAHILLNPMICDFGFGALLAIMFAQATTAGIRKPSQRYSLAGLGLLTLVTGVWLWSAAFTPEPELPRLFWGGLAGTLFVMSSLLFDLGGFSLRSRWLIRVTDLAFMVYLCHLFWNIGVDKASTMLPVSATIVLLVITPVAVTVIAAFAYYLIEKPLTRQLIKLPPWMALNQSGTRDVEPADKPLPIIPVAPHAQADDVQIV